MTTLTTFGDLLHRARGHLDAAAEVPDSALREESIVAAAQVTSRLALTLSRYLGDIAPGDIAEAITSSQLDPQVRSAVEAREALELAAEGLRADAYGSGKPGGDPAGPLAARLAQAATALAAGRDLLRTHFSTGPDRQWSPRSHWAPVITSGPVTRALAAEVAGWSRQLALITTRLSLAAQADPATPAPVRHGLAGSCPWLLTASATITAGQRDNPATAPDTDLLHVVPASIAPQPHPPQHAETAADLAAGLAISAERLRAIAQATSGQTARAPEMTADSWRWTATGAAVICHVSELMLTALADRAVAFTGAPGVTAHLRTAASSAANACGRWREVTAAWNQITTETKGLTAVGIADTSDLVVRLGRLAFTDAQWTPARAQRAPLRDPADLAPDAAQAAVVVGAIHHAADALGCLAAADLHAVDTADRAGRLFMPTRALPDYYDVPYRHGTATPLAVAALLDAYQAACGASGRAVTDLDALAVTTNAPSRILAAARAASRPANNTSTPDTAPIRPSNREPAPPAPSGPVEQEVRKLASGDPILLLRAKAIDKAARKLIAEAKDSTHEPGTPGSAEGNSRPVRPARTAARLAASSFPASPAAPVAGRQVGGPPCCPTLRVSMWASLVVGMCATAETPRGWCRAGFRAHGVGGMLILLI